MSHYQPTNKDLDKAIRDARIFIVIAIAVPVLALLLPKPSTVELGNWFGRSGAVTTVFALLAQAVLVKAKFWITPPGYGWVGLNEQRARYLPKFDWHENKLFVLTILGTVIWAYGDVPFL
ncbi:MULTISPECIES: hypothetical protein [Pseudomonas]|uniref:hypothetical protein n=1 Tax=Pseudomonas TaxID=286 RepID=UPI00168C0829|nr:MULTISPECIES: hypothetical protein [Pseudomonas]